jgi:sodium/potassium-transporting ATPase subunit alpha
MRFRLLELFKKKTPDNKKKHVEETCEKDENNNRVHKLPLDELAAQLGTSLTTGLDDQAAEELLRKCGKNKLKNAHVNPLCKIKKVLAYFFSGFGALFLFASIACILAWKPIGALDGTPDPVNLALGVLLFIVIVLQAGFNAFQDWSSNKVMKSIKNMMPSAACVIRNGKEKPIPVEEIVVGDVVRLRYGNKVPADCRIIETRDLKFDKSMLTGESEAVEGAIEATNESFVESRNMAFMTTLITNGQGKGLVVATGNQSMMGKIARLTDQTGHKKTSLQKEIQRFVNIIVTGAIIAAVVVIIAWATWLRVQYPNYINLTSLIVNTISVVIGFIPDGK